MNLHAVGKFLLTVLLVMVAIWAIKQASIRWNIPIIRTIAEGI